MAKLVLRDLVKVYSGKTAVHGINLEVEDGEFVALVGPSGCGKSTTLRMIAGLEEVSGGEIIIGERPVNEVEPRDREIAMVFQNYALYPHMNVRENMGFGLKLRGVDKPTIRQRVDEIGRVLDLSELMDRKPQALSGGQRQRVAMGRAMVRNPKVFLFDEPLSNLDAQLRGHMRTEIKKMHQTFRTTTIYVTHDQIEAMTLADRVVVMRSGHIEQVASPQELYFKPATRFVAGFIGTPAMNFLPVRIVASGRQLSLALETGVELAVPEERWDRYAPYAGRAMLLGLRPEHLDLQGSPAADGANGAFTATVELIEPMGSETLVHARVGNTPLCVKFGPIVAARAGDEMPLAARMAEMHLFDPDTGVAA